MSFKTASAILRGRWLVDKNWANAHMPLVFSVIKGEAKAASILGLSGDDDDDNEREGVTKNIGKNVWNIYPGANLNELPDGTIAFIDIDGPLLKQGDWCSYGMEDYAEMMLGITNCSNITGVILDIDSPGGQADGTATFADAIAECAKVKPVIGFIDDGLAASAAYWAVSACTEVYCSQPTDQVGSIGVYCTIADWYAYYASEGLPVKDVYAPQSDDKNLDYRESIAGNDDLLKAELKVIADAFISTVRANRKGKISGSDWAGGKMYFAADAVRLGLIDGVKSFNQVVFRLNRIISASKNSNNTMAFEKTLTVAGAQAFAVTDDGFVLQEEHLNAIEASLSNHAETEALLVTANSSIETLNTAVATHKETVTANAATIQTQTSRITELEAQVKQLGSQSSGTGTTVGAKVDERVKETVGTASSLPRYDSPDHPANQAADKVRPSRSL